jgi:hypothetical protein
MSGWMWVAIIMGGLGLVVLWAWVSIFLDDIRRRHRERGPK